MATLQQRLQERISDLEPKIQAANPNDADASDEDDAVQRIATAASGRLEDSDLRMADIDCRLDPASEKFDFRFWASTFIALATEDGLKRPLSGFTFRSLAVSGSASTLGTHRTVGSPFKLLLRSPFRSHGTKTAERPILHPMNGSVNSGELLLVLGRPGSGCTTFLKTISGQSRGLTQSKDSSVLYEGVPQDIFMKEFKGRAVYCKENDEHFPYLTVGQTLLFAAAARTPRSRIQGVSRDKFASHATDVVMKVFGLSHTKNTIVGNDTVRGVSGGERKRVSLAEMALGRSSIAAWDNATRGLDSATALEFTQALRTSADIASMTHVVAIYQASQNIFDQFDKVMVLYEGHQIYFGPISRARSYFETMGWLCPPSQTTPDFLTSVTNPSERVARPDHGDKVPRTAEDFEKYWLKSEECAMSLHALDNAEGAAQSVDHLEEFRDAHHMAQAKHARNKSSYVISIPQQIKLCQKRSRQLLWNEKSQTLVLLVTRVALALIIGSIFHDPPDNTSALASRGSVIFLAVLLNALFSINEIGTLFARRPIVDKHNALAFYHPWADAFAGISVDMPVKIVITAAFNVTFYQMSSLRKGALPVIVFMIFNFVCALLMSAFFRSIGASMARVAKAYALAGLGVLAMIIYTGFTLQTSYMHPWFRWINYINPIAYVFEALMVNEVHNRDYPCAPSSIVPPYPNSNGHFACTVVGAVTGQDYVSGDNWVSVGYGYSYSHLWRNFAIIIGYLVVFQGYYLFAIERNSLADSEAQRLAFLDGKGPNAKNQHRSDIESVTTDQVGPVVGQATSTNSEEAQTSRTEKKVKSLSSTLVWHDMNLVVPYQKSTRTLLQKVTGWVKPGDLTCLMGVSGAGKTTLLDVLAQRHANASNVTGDIMVDGGPLRRSFQRSTGYCQQQDLHLSTSTVREALYFSSYLRQGSSVSKEQKYEWAEEVIQMLKMEDFSDAVIGEPGEGLNLEQRKLLTIGVELASKPDILFLDEPTSGLDSQSSWTIITLLRRLADSGQAIISTIHQPSAMLLSQFDAILLLAKGGRPVYFGPVGQECRTLTDYFASSGARKCQHGENPAEYMLEVIRGTEQDWPVVWNDSLQYKSVETEAQSLLRSNEKANVGHTASDDKDFASSFTTQMKCVLSRLFQNYWRSPAYVGAKFMASIMSALFIGFTFYIQNNSATGLQNSVFSIFMLNATFQTAVNQVRLIQSVQRYERSLLTLFSQIMSRFNPHRSLFEVREGPSKIYSWPVFILSHVLVEIPYQMFLSVLVWASWYFATFGAQQSPLQQGMMLVFTTQFLVFASTFAHMVVVAMPTNELAGNLSTFLFSMTLQFNGVLQPPSALPSFWIWMYRVSPFTYLIGGWAGTSLAGREVNCSQNELAIFDPPKIGQTNATMTCGAYLSKYMAAGAPGYLVDPLARSNCEYCYIRNADQFLDLSGIQPSDKWRNMGVLFGYIMFNICAALTVYYLFRVRKVSVIKPVKRLIGMFRKK